jgi:hypothetical protein
VELDRLRAQRRHQQLHVHPLQGLHRPQPGQGGAHDQDAVRRGGRRPDHAEGHAGQAAVAAAVHAGAGALRAATGRTRSTAPA